MIIDKFKRIVMVIASKDMTAIDAILAEDLQMSGGGRTYGKAAYLDLLQMYFQGFPDFAYNFGDAVQAGNQIETTYQITGTHTGTLDLNLIGIEQVIPATGNAIRLAATPAVVSIIDDKVSAVYSRPVEGGSLQDLLGQLGIAF